MRKEELKAFLGNKFFTINFTKIDGTNRTMRARLGVKRYLSDNPNKITKTPNNTILSCYDIEKKEYRCFKLDTINWIKARKMLISKID